MTDEAMDELRRRRSERQPVALNVRLAFGDVREFVDRYATNISDGGIFIRSRDPRPVGSRLAFELRLRNGDIAFAGEGVVRWVETLDARGLGTPGMGIQFEKITEGSRDLLTQILDARSEEKVPPPVAAANPSTWRPLEEFPALPEPAPAVEEEAPKAPPVVAPVTQAAPPAEPGAKPAEPLPAWMSGIARWTASAQASAPAPKTAVPPVVPAPPTMAPASNPPAPVVPPNVVPPNVVPPNVVPPTSALVGPKDAALTPQVLANALGTPAGDAALTPQVLAPALATPDPREKTSPLFARGGTDPMMRAVPLVAGPPPAPPVMVPVARAPEVVAKGVEPVVIGTANPAESGTISAPLPKALATVGIDLGWSWIRAALAQGETVKPLARLPAVATYVRGQLVLGEAALEAVGQGAAPVRGLFRLAGATAGGPAAKAWSRREVLPVEEGADGGAVVRVGREKLSPTAALGGLLAEVRARASAVAGADVRRAAVAVPVALTPARRRALREAAAAAGFESVKLVPAATAVVLARHGAKGRRRVLVVDFGESEAEVVVVEQSGHVLELAGVAADAELGGLEIDLALVGAVLTAFEKETGLLVPEDVALFERVRAEAQRVKHALNDALEAEVLLPALVPAGLSKADLRQRVPRAKLLALAGGVIDRAYELSRQALAARGHGGADLDEVVLSGGQGRLGAMARRLAEKLGREPVGVEGGDLAAAGAALLGEGERGIGRHLCANVAGASLGFANPGGAFRRVIERHQNVPLEKTWTVATTADNETQLQLPLFQGEKTIAEENECVGTVVVGPLPRGPKGEVRVGVTLALAEDGELTVRARDLSTGRELPAQLDVRRTAPGAR